MAEDKVGGRGFGSFLKGDVVTNMSQVRPGMILLDHSNQFNANNTVMVTKTWEDKIWVVYYHDRLSGYTEGGQFCIWDFEVEHKRTELWIANREGKEGAPVYGKLDRSHS